MYEIREVIVKNGSLERSIWVINFHDSKYDILGEFLMTDAPAMSYRILKDIEEVLSGERDRARVSGNRCSLEITPELTKLEDLFDGLFENFDTYPPVEIETLLLRDLIVMWKERTEKEE